ncbi:GDP-mannose 4,6-dehydratase, partial [Rhodoferax sp. 4810]|nr:GDP-mannose 4,6-dehydratase [Rhodoferax jenense]
YLTAINEQRFTERVGEKYLDALRQRIALTAHLSSLTTSSTPLVAVDPAYYRPTEVELLIGDPSKAMNKLGWKPEYDLQGLVTDMMQSDITVMKKDAWLQEGGFRTMNYFE